MSTDTSETRTKFITVGFTEAEYASLSRLIGKKKPGTWAHGALLSLVGRATQEELRAEIRTLEARLLEATTTSSRLLFRQLSAHPPTGSDVEPVENGSAAAVLPVPPSPPAVRVASPPPAPVWNAYRRESIGERVQRWFDRHRRLLAGVLAVEALVAGLLWWLSQGGV